MVKIKKGKREMEVSEGAYKNFYESAGWEKDSVPVQLDEWDQVLSEEEEQKERKHERARRG